MLRFSSSSSASIVAIVAIFATLALAGQPADAATADPHEYFTVLGKEVQQFLDRELPQHDRQALRGHVATIDVRYSAQGQFETATVRSADMNILAVTAHRKLVWKNLPAGIRQTVAHLEIQVSTSGGIVINCASR